jgi:hypothetical protein
MSDFKKATLCQKPQDFKSTIQINQPVMIQLEFNFLQTQASMLANSFMSTACLNLACNNLYLTFPGTQVHTYAPLPPIGLRYQL